MLSFQEVQNKNFVQAWINRICGTTTELISRPASYIIRREEEQGHRINRVILLPPNGYTANASNQASSHDEALKATLKIKGAIRAGKQNFSIIKNCLLVASFNKNAGVSDLPEPYMRMEDLNESLLQQSFHTAGTPPFSIVKPDGTGFYHNLINLTEHWLALELNKTLRPQRLPNIAQGIAGIPQREGMLLRQLYNNIIAVGDGIFKQHQSLIYNITALNPNISLPALTEMLYAYDTGRHEACSAFAIILKIGKRHPEFTKAFLSEKITQQKILPYYAAQLIEKIDRYEASDPNVPIP